MKYKCINCPWEGEEIVGALEHCPKCGDNTERTEKEVPKEEPESIQEKELDLDLNKDGKVDKKDFSLAAKVLRRGRKLRK